ncbi:MAG: nucleotidyltransferase family protein [Gemmatimonadota bacterium]|nr:nucleotidyltransferase family protein [Gemmatimonadota bacterium]
MAPLQIDLPHARINDFCCRWRITELAAFGSVLRGDFEKDSDVDLLVSFTPGADHSLLDMVQMQEELTEILQRPVDLIEEQGLRNPFRRKGILSTKEVIYAA